MSKSTHHSFDVNLAAEFSIEAAIIIHHFQHWINHNKTSGKNFLDGRTWTYQTRKEIANWFTYLSPHQVRRITDKLVKIGVLIKGNYNKKGNDDTIWYAFVDEGKYITEVDEKSAGKSANPKEKRAGKTVNQVGKSVKPLPDTKTDTKTLSKEREGDKPPRTPKKEKIVKSPKKERAPNVSTTDEEHKLLVDKHGSQKVEAAYQVLSEWKGNTKKSKWRPSDKGSIDTWVFDAMEEKDIKAQEIEKRKSILKGNTQAKRPSQLNNENEGDFVFDESRVKTYTNNRG